MNNLQGIIARGVHNANMGYETLSYITSSAVNQNTNAYKGVRFENYLKENGRLEGTVRVNYAQGGLLRTDNPFDVAIDGAGFIPITEKDGSISYTRDGSFRVGKGGYLYTNDKALVGNGIKITPNHERIIIEKDGTVSALMEKAGKPIKLGKIDLVQFDNPEGLEQIHGNRVVATEESGEPTLVKNHSSIKQSMIERSNVSMYDVVNQTLMNNASLIANIKLIKVTDEMYRQAINLK